MSRKRIKFHSIEDLSGGYYLSEIEKLLTDSTDMPLTSINDFIEIDNIKRYFDNGLFLSKWNEELIEKFNNKTDLLWDRNKQFWSEISNEKFLAFFEETDISYKSDFWRLFCFFHTYKRINSETLLKMLEKYPHQIRTVLQYGPIVTHYDTSLRQFLMHFDESAELLLYKLSETKRIAQYYFPNSLTLEDREDIICRYIEQTKPNLNFIRLIVNSKDGDIKLSPKTRFKANQKAEELKEEIFEEGFSMPIGTQIAISKDQMEPVLHKIEGTTVNISYSHNLFDQQPTKFSLFLLFRNLFEYTDKKGLISLVSRSNETGILEAILMRPKNAYPETSTFIQKDQISLVQLILLSHYLESKATSIENLIEYVVNDFLPLAFGIFGLRIQLPGSDLSYVERIRVVAPELESLLKQYHSYAEDGKIDFDMIEFNSIPLSFSDVRSVMFKRYAYCLNDEMQAPMHLFFSDQSPLIYTERFQTKHPDFYNLIINEVMILDDFAAFQKPGIQFLVDKGYLIVDGDNRLSLVNNNEVKILQDLFEDDVISYYTYDEKGMLLIEQMVKLGKLRFDNKLFTRSEKDYMNFYLNKKDFTNGHNIRNKYLHGSNTQSKNIHKQEYFMLLRILILVILKISEDLFLQKTNN